MTSITIPLDPPTVAYHNSLLNVLRIAFRVGPCSQEHSRKTDRTESPDGAQTYLQYNLTMSQKCITSTRFTPCGCHLATTSPLSTHNPLSSPRLPLQTLSPLFSPHPPLTSGPTWPTRTPLPTPSSNRARSRLNSVRIYAQGCQYSPSS